jgi:uncharacterized Tic20 family protein
VAVAFPIRMALVRHLYERYTRRVNISISYLLIPSLILHTTCAFTSIYSFVEHLILTVMSLLGSIINGVLSIAGALTQQETNGYVWPLHDCRNSRNTITPYIQLPIAFGSSKKLVC